MKRLKKTHTYQLQSPNNGQLPNKIQNTGNVLLGPEWSLSTKKKQKYQPIWAPFHGHWPLGFLREGGEAVGYLLPCLISALRNEKDSH